MGVFLHHSHHQGCDGSLPHARGGVSQRLGSILRGLRSSPRTWGCFYRMTVKIVTLVVFPTHVGVFPIRSNEGWNRGGLPHARGGVSVWRWFVKCPMLSSPRTWGCFYLKILEMNFYRVFPTHVGVFLAELEQENRKLSLPHARGGVSFGFHSSSFALTSSPRTWGCFYFHSFLDNSLQVFPTHVGVFLYAKNC